LAGLFLVAHGQLHAGDTALAPDHAAGADRGFEDRKLLAGHGFAPSKALSELIVGPNLGLENVAIHPNPGRNPGINKPCIHEMRLCASNSAVGMRPVPWDDDVPSFTGPLSRAHHADPARQWIRHGLYRRGPGSAGSAAVGLRTRLAVRLSQLVRRDRAADGEAPRDRGEPATFLSRPLEWRR